MDKLPDYMKGFYKALLEAFEEIEEYMIKEGTSYRLTYGIEAVTIQFLLFESIFVIKFFVPDKIFSYFFLQNCDKSNTSSMCEYSTYCSG